MAASTAPGKTKKTKDGSDPTSKIVTFRLNEEARQKVVDYALALGQSFSPSRQISNNEAAQHMILNSKLPEAARKSNGS
jgi:hypothetical protein